MRDRTDIGLREVVACWALHGVVAAVVLVTYARLPAAELYNVTGSGLEGGASRALLVLGYPTSLAVLAFLPFVVERLAHPAATAAAVVAAGLCLTIGIPGVIDESDLEARPVNALAGAGVALALGLTLFALVRGGLGPRVAFSRSDWMRVAVGVALLLAAIPWLAAELGFYAGGIFMSDELRPEPGQPTLRAVHLGHHHGTDGVVLAWTALLLSRPLGQLRRRPVRRALTAYLALMLVYGLANALQDFWLEQVVKRGTTDVELPSMLRPALTPAWGALLLAAALIYLAFSRVDKVRRPPRRYV